MIEPRSDPPGPVLGRPRVRLAIRAARDEFEEFTVGDGNRVDPELRHGDGRERELIVPAEWERVEGRPEGRRPRRDRDDLPSGPRAAKHVTGQPGGSGLVLGSQLPDHVQEGLLVHELVLDDHGEHAPAPRHEVHRRPLGYGVDGLQHRSPHAIAVREHGGEVGPALRRLGMVVTPLRVVHVGVDAAREDVVELGVERRAAQRAGADMVPGERRQMPDVEDERMPERDRPCQERVGLQRREDLVRALPGAGESLDHGVHPALAPVLRGAVGAR